MTKRKVLEIPGKFTLRNKKKNERRRPTRTRWGKRTEMKRNKTLKKINLELSFVQRS